MVVDGNDFYVIQCFSNTKNGPATVASYWARKT